MTTLFYVAATAALSFATVASAAPELPVTKGYVATMNTKSRIVCIHAISASEAERTGVRVGRTECRSRSHWAAEGLFVTPRQTLAG